MSEGPEERSICFYGSHDTVCWRSREQVYIRASAVARRLSREGVRPGDVCVIVLPSGESAANTVLATLFLGAIPLLIAPPALVGGNLEVHETLRSALRRTRPRVVAYSGSSELDFAGLERSFSATRFVVPDVEDIETQSEPFTPFFPSPTDIAAMQLTSGTTTAPRICVWDQKGVSAALTGMAEAMGLSPADVCV